MKIRAVDDLSNGDKKLIDAIDQSVGATDAGKVVILNQYGMIDPSMLDMVSPNVVLADVDCEASVYVGSAVIMNSSGVAVNALADGIPNSNVIGIVQSKSSAIKCDIRVSGVTPEIFSGLVVESEYYLSDTINGGIVVTPTTTSGHIRLKLGQPFSSTRLMVMKGERLIKA